MKTTTQNHQIGTTAQAATYQEHLTTENGRKLRIEIKSDSYAAQSYARIDLHDGDKWQELASIPSSSMATKTGLVYEPRKPTPADFTGDVARLLQLAADILI